VPIIRHKPPKINIPTPEELLKLISDFVNQGGILIILVAKSGKKQTRKVKKGGEPDGGGPK
jgi:hypothetical protein